MVFITEGFFEVAIESWPEWDLNPRTLREGGRERERERERELIDISDKASQ